ncbi:hypothetical protein [Streptomyces sp. NBC_00151]|uniref:hypothetical protein n=1 Tax=Streptomyces sp. NBC_00151 TaxID=2975669 RepID=UPI002DD9D772|nr:hypothetical protein [Streptomyces sp. NBC_00151]WRZ37057.1 hypothetical protein OG915_02660 [Streptomyces sp. NBC_00151]
MSHDDGASPAPRSGAPTYTVLMAEARRQSALARPTTRSRREADIRKVRWWRVRTLRNIAGLSTLATALVFTLLLLAICWLGGPSILPDAWFPLLVSVGMALYGAYQLRGAGGATARTLAHAACAPDPVPKRYALVYDPPWGGVALLVLFQAAGGDDVRPDAVLELRPLPQTWRRFLGASKLPADLPVEPAGELELRGRTDGSPMGVPWIDGRAYWPKRSYGSDDLMRQEGQALMARLLADATEEADAID